MSKVLYFQISTAPNSTSGLHPEYPSETPFTINGQTVAHVASDQYKLVIEDDPFAIIKSIAPRLLGWPSGALGRPAISSEARSGGRPSL
jgi:hypothetical protein